ncbi:MAG: hypothetical protein A2887_02090 [Alphaproteobacteria bacterium RIFCSPLOWO2_01_FULL_40_26]|nr:MAG: hypothetical protein A3D15_02855 [Alphaproteobacteria bacterium RIFCSPHIGHO2_02_FULL_40_34]OFW85837.1 MAG: hypothetical protein A2794_01745 [Alphaproteobacteria bacterium RIFCSPHIGHO2_01_FULL_40_8]OFW94759.1 MAG: hypothetical protein A2887_02090 [Alphaproteobacteria bacterium RIFCSPLOWO2_01_FULL_40_26]OFX10387.1 MAG: hypothetical protein A3H30_03080 [Alphaproteobacteria bacterium RIFCSPLOWO2_02_FULL_40_19]OFX11268.1 MAG: hypothetical protein A3G22_05975 [Alphaproteobacteria bacterium RI
MFDVLAPKIYLSQNTLKLLNSGTGTTSGNIREQQGMGSVIAAAGDLIINSPSAGTHDWRGWS